MKRNELRALGMTPEQIDAVMKLNGDDVNRPESRHRDQEQQGSAAPAGILCGAAGTAGTAREAVRGILLHASRLYCEQERRKSQEGQQ